MLYHSKGLWKSNENATEQAGSRGWRYKRGQIGAAVEEHCRPSGYLNVLFVLIKLRPRKALGFIPQPSLGVFRPSSFTGITGKSSFVLADLGRDRVALHHLSICTECAAWKSLRFRDSNREGMADFHSLGHFAVV